MLRVHIKEVLRKIVDSDEGHAKFENGILTKGFWGRGRDQLSLMSLNRREWIDLLTFLDAVWREMVGGHYELMRLTGKYIWIEFEEDANLGAILEEYIAKYAARFGVAPNRVVLHPLQEIKGEWPSGLSLIRQDITPVGTFKIGYEEPKDAEASVSN